MTTLPSNANTQILILAPTNKAADVLTRKILGLPQAASAPEWLIRFGSTSDNELERLEILKPKEFDIRNYPTNVTVTTIARLPYDYFILGECKRLPLRNVNWDYVIIDEASMIHLPYILYPLYKCHPQKFIIAGDPFQIQPIATIDAWMDENIYTLVNLESFNEPKTYPMQYDVRCLTTQYRAIPKIGELFSRLFYNSALDHHRTSQMGLRPPAEFSGLNSINIIKFPVRKHESVYRPQKLKNSPYHTYSALFAFELVKYLASLHWKMPNSGKLRIGVISPYRVQADIVAKLIEGASFPVEIEVQAGTIHGYQGDECEVIIALFNPPAGSRHTSNAFINKKNIVNVAVSRARDYLFILMPDDETEGINTLSLIKNLEKTCLELGCSVTAASEIEKRVFGKKTWIEENSFSTSHQDVNVYREPERKYEIRCEENAIDVQIHNE